MVEPLNKNFIAPPKIIARQEKSPEQKPKTLKCIRHQISEVGRNRSNVIPLRSRQVSFLEDLLGDG